MGKWEKESGRSGPIGPTNIHSSCFSNWLGSNIKGILTLILLDEEELSDDRNKIRTGKKNTKSTPLSENRKR
jgi:hypothetical protein